MGTRGLAAKTYCEPMALPGRAMPRRILAGRHAISGLSPSGVPAVEHGKPCMSSRADVATNTDTSRVRTRLLNGPAHLVAAVIAIASACWIFAASPLAFYSGVIDGMAALGIVAAASASGLWLVWATGNGDLPVRWQIGLGAGFGLGMLSLGMLAAGLAGELGRQSVDRHHAGAGGSGAGGGVSAWADCWKRSQELALAGKLPVAPSRQRA